MKGLIATVVLGAILTFGLSGIGAKVAQDTEAENLRKAGQEVLQRLEDELQTYRKGIEKYIQGVIPEDEKVSSKEIQTLLRKVRMFNKDKERADKRLKIYGLKTATTIDQEIERTLSGYRTRDRSGKIRKLFAELIGKDLPVDRDVDEFFIIFGGCLSFFGVVVLIEAIQPEERGSNIVWGIIFFVSGVVGILWFGIEVF